MKTIAVICEYNPFHSGHEYHIRKIRECFGDDAAIIAVMSGNYTQRGEVAIVNKHVRAKCALLGGCDLVLELPFPYSSSCAEIFASSAIHIIDSLGICDYVSFGSECGDIQALAELAAVTSTDEFDLVYREISKDKTLAHPKICELAYNRIAKNAPQITFTPNNILAIEYLKALNSLGSSVKPHTVLRSGAGYTDTRVSKSQHPSAMAVRSLIKSGVDSLPLPDYCITELNNAKESGDMPCDVSRLSTAIISKLRLNPPPTSEEYFDAGNGLYNRLYNASLEASDIKSLTELTESKGYTNARIRRALLNSFIGVTSSDVKSLPEYTQILAMNRKGMLLMKNARKTSRITILTKPSATDMLTELGIKQKSLSDIADQVYELTKPEPKSAKDVFRFSPFII